MRSLIGKARKWATDCGFKVLSFFITPKKDPAVFLPPPFFFITGSREGFVCIKKNGGRGEDRHPLVYS